MLTKFIEIMPSLVFVGKLLFVISVISFSSKKGLKTIITVIKQKKKKKIRIVFKHEREIQKKNSSHSNGRAISIDKRYKCCLSNFVW